MKHSVLRYLPGLCALTAATAFFTACGDDDFAPVSRNRGYDYAFTSTKEFAEYPCNDVREGREAIVGRDKDSYYCEFDSRDSVYIWVGDTDTLTAEGRKFHRAESSSSSYRSSSSYSYEEVFNPDIDYGPMTDPRDGKTYRTVVVNGQLWMAENLNYSGNNVGKAPCYNNRDSLCAQFGRLYSRDAAMDDSRCEYLSSCDLGEGPIQGICPDGWHIPTVEEMEDLVDFVGDYAPRYKSMGSTWSYNDGTDTYGLSFLGAGNWDSDDGFEDINRYEVTWAYAPDTYQHYLLLGGSNAIVEVMSYKDSEYYSSVRCVKGKANPVSSSSYSSSSARSSSSSYSSSSSSYRSSSSYYTSVWSSENPSSSFSISSKEDLFNPSLTYGTMTDPRDGKTYKTIEFNGQTWMAENLNFSDSSIVPLLEGHNTCYHEKESECELMGRLYSRDAAMNSSSCAFGRSCSLGDGPIQGICPDGWHVLTYSEAKNLVNYVESDEDKIRSHYGWGASAVGTNDYGLSFVATGSWEAGNYDSRGGFSYTWTYYNGYSNQYYLLVKYNDVSISSYSSKEVYFPVRCIKDGPVSSSSVSSSSVSSSSRAKQEDAEPLLETAGEQFNPDIEYGTMTDPRDNKTYKTVKVGSATWMAENLNYASNEIGVSTCFNDDDRFCELYGHFYSRSAAMNSSSCAYKSSCDLGTGHIQGICPDGWHIPTNKEAQDLVNLASGHALPLMSAKGWKTGITPGTDTYGLSFVGTGSYCSDDGFHSLGEYGRLWVYYASSTQYYIVIRGSENEAEVWDYNDEECYNPVRCVKD
ncbi:major paralogous domain-containing protein [Fibrobacter sp. UWR3]|uniref:FISUMP domain-containing protein n=1 Tax=Fibrobacter sp. UWR3 TaxID=1896217 RepID=UPI00091C5EE5|nr:FISUMP domain-containing protein [Fibrobacter sp. UWR3]SHM92454.1 major paralogous domain-containing protein [Fibrobacter sp. UWR3]